MNKYEENRGMVQGQKKQQQKQRQRGRFLMALVKDDEIDGTVILERVDLTSVYTVWTPIVRQSFC
ncbi:MAG: hypothetical protein FWE44_01755 [Defluviitaleaceae bacterium]|nr:hypothetical protein [Defluviitaleaceae bacterium]